MGNWNRRRWQPRKNNYQQPPPSPPRHRHSESNSRGVREIREAPWEVRFCTSMGISWEKIVVTKRYVYCHEKVFKWNDSAGEDAFYNAKKRFWAKINGLPCDTPLPDPGMYIDKIDWNPEIDPELIIDLDREYYNPDEVEKVDKVENKNKKMNNVSSCALGWDDKNPGNDENPWECSQVQGTGALKDAARGWDRWDTSMNVENVGSPWERSSVQGDGTLKDTKWGGCGDRSWGWNQGLNCSKQSKRLDNERGNPWDRVNQSSGSVKENGWADVGNNSSCWNHGETSLHESRNMENGDNPWKTQPRGPPKDRRWRDCGDNSWDWKGWQNKNNEPEQFDSRRLASNRGCRKREGSQQHTSRYKSMRFQGEDSGIGHQWGKRTTQKRVGFVFE